MRILSELLGEEKHIGDGDGWMRSESDCQEGLVCLFGDGLEGRNDDLVSEIVVSASALLPRWQFMVRNKILCSPKTLDQIIMLLQTCISPPLGSLHVRSVSLHIGIAVI